MSEHHSNLQLVWMQHQGTGVFAAIAEPWVARVRRDGTGWAP